MSTAIGTLRDLVKAKKPKSAKDKKFEKVMGEFKEGKLRSGSGAIVTDRDQALAIAASEAGIARKAESATDRLRTLAKAKLPAAEVEFYKLARELTDTYSLYRPNRNFALDDVLDELKYYYDADKACQTLQRLVLQCSGKEISKDDYNKSVKVLNAMAKHYASKRKKSSDSKDAKVEVKPVMVKAKDTAVSNLRSMMKARLPKDEVELYKLAAEIQRAHNVWKKHDEYPVLSEMNRVKWSYDAESAIQRIQRLVLQCSGRELGDDHYERLKKTLNAYAKKCVKDREQVKQKCEKEAKTTVKPVLVKAAIPGEADPVATLTELMKAPYRGKGRRTGTPGNYKYEYGTPGDGAGKKRDDVRGGAAKKESPTEKRMRTALASIGITDGSYDKSVVSFLKDNDLKLRDIQKVNQGDYGFGYTIETSAGDFLALTETDARASARADIDNLIDDMGVSAFNKDFWQNHIDKEKLGRDLAMDSHIDRELGTENPEDYLDEDPAGKDGDWTDEQREKAGDKAEEAYEERVKEDPVGYLEEIYGDIGEFPNLESYVDQESLIEEAINIDGVAHFLSRYDGEEHEHGSHFFYRIN